MSWKTLLRLVPRDLGESIAGDLEEEFLARRDRCGAARARVWLWFQAARVAATFRWERAAHGRSLPPIGDEIRASRPWESIRQDIVFGVRLMRRQRAFTAVAVAVLALGTGANTAIFSVVDSVLWRPLSYARADRIVALGESRPREGRVNGPVSPADFYDWRRDARSFTAVAAYSEVALNMTGRGEPQRLVGLSVTSAFLSALGVRPALGRDFREQEEMIGHDRVVLLTDTLWRNQFGADASVVGHTASFDGNLYEVIGVLPAAFWWPSQPDMLVPLALSDHDRALRGAHFLGAVARRHETVSFAHAREEMTVIGRRLSAAFPLENANHAPSVLPLRDALVGDTRTPLLMLLSAVVLVLLIACANVATLLLARATTRQKELAVRMAIGGARCRLIQQLLTESVVLAAVGGSVGLLLASWWIAVLRQVLPPQFSALPGIERLAIDTRVFLTTGAIAMFTGLVFGAGPAVIASDQRVSSALNDGARGSSGETGRRLRSVLVVAELPLSVVLLAGAGFLLMSFKHLTEISPGFRSQQLQTLRLTLPASRYGDHMRAVAFYRALVERLRVTPGVEHVAGTSALPFSGFDARLDLQIEKREVESPLPVRAHPHLVTPDYFQTMGIPLVRGRLFTDRDTADATPVVIINQSATSQFWAGRDPLGERISLGAPERWMEVIGVVGDIRHGGLDTAATPEAYIPYEQPFTALGAGLVRSMSLVVRTSADVTAVAPQLRAAVASIDDDHQPIGLIRPMDELIAQSVAPRRLNVMLLSVFALVAVGLTAAGLYGVMAYLVTQRTREIGVRMALGASPASVLALVLRQAGTMTITGIGIGLAGAYALAQSLASLLFQVSAADPMVYVGVLLVVTVVAVLAVIIPSSRATRIDPLTALHGL